MEVLKGCPWCGKEGRVVTPVGMSASYYQAMCCNPICTMWKVAGFADKERERVVEIWNDRKGGAPRRARAVG